MNDPEPGQSKKAPATRSVENHPGDPLSPFAVEVGKGVYFH
jgi:hypothetical protein